MIFRGPSWRPKIAVLKLKSQKNRIPRASSKNIRISNAFEGQKSTFLEEAEKAKMCFPSRRGVHFRRNRGVEVAMPKKHENGASGGPMLGSKKRPFRASLALPSVFG